MWAVLLPASEMDTALMYGEGLSKESAHVRAKTNQLPCQILPLSINAIDSCIMRYSSPVIQTVPVSLLLCQECVIKLLGLSQSDRFEIVSV